MFGWLVLRTLNKDLCLLIWSEHTPIHLSLEAESSESLVWRMSAVHCSSVEQQSFALTWKNTPDLQILATCMSVFIYSSHVIILMSFTISPVHFSSPTLFLYTSSPCCSADDDWLEPGTRKMASLLCTQCNCSMSEAKWTLPFLN